MTRQNPNNAAPVASFTPPLSTPDSTHSTLNVVAVGKDSAVDDIRQCVDWSHWFWSKVHPEALSGCWLWHGALKSTSGYRGKKRKHPYGGFSNKPAHRIAFELVNGPIPSGLVVRHTCDVTLCVNPDHLLLGTQRDNIADKVARNRQQRLRGETNGRATLTWASVREIRRRLSAGEKQWDLAHAYGVGQGVISKILRGSSWREPGMGPPAASCRCSLCGNRGHNRQRCALRVRAMETAQPGVVT